MIAIAKPTTRYEPSLLCNEPLLRVINCDFGLASLPVSARPETQVRGLGWSRSRSGQAGCAKAAAMPRRVRLKTRAARLAHFGRLQFAVTVYAPAGCP